MHMVGGTKHLTYSCVPAVLPGGGAVLGIKRTPVNVAAESPIRNQPKPNDLIKACGEGNLQYVSELLDVGADVNGAGLEGRTPLMAAASRGHRDVVELLLKSGADAEATDRSGWTPGKYAIQYGHDEVDMLLQDPYVLSDTVRLNPMFDFAQMGDDENGIHLNDFVKPTIRQAQSPANTLWQPVVHA